ncbi:nephrin-like [Antedon mediterranea]|uniref:nephrin-like n=1 Tax=Antedon mediterranea TaxID=105859 RepID=UPI003AF9C951
MAVFMTVVLLFAYCVSQSECTTIVRGPEDAEYIEGNELAYIFCILQGYNEMDDIFWEKDGVRIENSQKYVYNVDYANNIFGIFIKGIERSDRGEYNCAVFVEKTEETVESEPAVLTIHEIPPERYPRIETMEPYKAGDSAVISCISEYTNPRPELALYRSGNNKPLLAMTIIDEGINIIKITYSFTPTIDDNNSKFCCKLTIPRLAFVRYGNNVTIDVQFAPVLSIKHEEVLESGKIAVLICETTESNPEARDYEWSHKDGQLFTDNFSANGKIMRIKNPTQYLNGTVLVCSARNSIGIAITEVTLYVEKGGMSGSDRPSTIAGSAEQNGQKSMDILLKTVIIAGIITISVITLLVLPLCLHHVCINRHAIDSLGRKISQPQIYFEANDRVLPTPPENMENYTWKRSLAVQVPDDLEIDIEMVYQEISDKCRSSRNTLAKNTSTYS